MSATDTHREAAPLTPEQIKNWREVLFSMIGSYAYLMTDAEVQMHKDMTQRRIDARQPEDKK